MVDQRVFVGREQEIVRLREPLLDGRNGGASAIVFIAGEAGIGKSRLVREALRDVERPVLYGLSRGDTSNPYGPVVDMLRAYLRDDPGRIPSSALAEHLSLLLPELGPAPAQSDPATLSEAICEVLAAAAGSGSILVLEDLQWADGSTLELLTKLPDVQERCGLAIIATYRSDEVSRLHMLRRVRSELKRRGRLMEIALDPLSHEETRELVSELHPSLTGSMIDAIHERSRGIPFFVEELAGLAADGRSPGAEQLEQALPESVADAIRMRVAPLSPEERSVLELTATAGAEVDLAFLSEIADPDALVSLAERGWLINIEGRTAAFRHQLVRDAIYLDIPWVRRRELHRSLARALEERSGPAEEIARHWLDAHEPERARPHLLQAARAFSAVHAYREAERALRTALGSWDDTTGDRDRVEALDLLASTVELSGNPDEALGSWRDVARRRGHIGDPAGRARAERHIATLLEIRGEREQAVAARISAAESFAQSAQPEEAAAERLAAAAHLRGAGHLEEAVRLVELAAGDVEASRARHLRIRLLALHGEIRTQLGESTGVELIREALDLALSEDLVEPAVDTYYRLSNALEYALRYSEAIAVMQTAAAFCDARGITGMGEVCHACTTPAMRIIGQWKEAVSICRRILKDPEVDPFASNVAAVELGLIDILRGDVEEARRLIAPVLPFGEAKGVIGLVVESYWGLTMLHAHDDRADDASATARDFVARCRTIEEWHYSLSPLRWSSTWFAEQGDAVALAEVVDALSVAASRTGSPEANAALAFGLAEVARLQGEVDRAAVQARRVLDLVDEIDAVYEAAEMRARCATMLADTDRDRAIAALVASYRTAKKLGARPLLGRVVGLFEGLGEPIEPHLGMRAAGGAERAGLTRRELEVLRHIATGRTNKEVAKSLFLSPRTVDMHVRNLLMKLGSRTRAEAVHRAGELGLLGDHAPRTTASAEKGEA